MTEPGADGQSVSDGQSMHGFTPPDAGMPHRGLVHNERADHRSRLATLDFFNEML